MSPRNRIEREIKAAQHGFARVRTDDLAVLLSGVDEREALRGALAAVVAAEQPLSHAVAAARELLPEI